MASIARRHVDLASTHLHVNIESSLTRRRDRRDVRGQRRDVEIKETETRSLTLLDKERIDTTLDLRDGLRGGEADGTADLFLTDRRLVHLAADGRRRRASFVSIQDITAIDINSERGYGLAAFLWGALALFVAVTLWRVWEHPVGSALAGLAVAGMGAYLVIDRLMSPPKVRAIFRTGNGELRFDIDSPSAARDIHGFVNRLFQLKDEAAARTARGARTFSPR
jgi:hypothetical protein